MTVYCVCCGGDYGDGWHIGSVIGVFADRIEADRVVTEAKKTKDNEFVSFKIYESTFYNA